MYEFIDTEENMEQYTIKKWHDGRIVSEMDYEWLSNRENKLYSGNYSPFHYSSEKMNKRPAFLII